LQLCYCYCYSYTLLDIWEFVLFQHFKEDRIKQNLELERENSDPNCKMEDETETMVEKREIINNVMCLLTDPDGTPLGAPMYLPQNAGPQHLIQIVNKLLNNVTKPLSPIPKFYFTFIIFIFIIIK